MRACRSRVQARTAPNLAVLILAAGAWAAALLLGVPQALGQTSASSRSGSTRDTTAAARADDEGFSVRIVEGGKAITVDKPARRAGAQGIDVPEPPDVPDIPDVPEPPDYDDSNDLVRFGEDVTIPAGKVIDGDVVALGGSVTVYGRVKGDCVALGGTVSVKDHGVIEGDAVSLGGGVVTADSADVRGSNVSIGAWPFKGHGHGAMWPVLGLFGLSAFAGVVIRVAEFLLTLFFAWLALLLFRERIVSACDRMGARFGASFLYGLLGWAALLVTVPAGVILMALVGALAIVILCITIIGIPVAILVAVALVLGIVGLVIAVIAAAFLAYVNGAMFLGRRLLGATRGAAASPIKAVLIGLLLMAGLAILGKVLGFLGFVLLMPIGIAFGIAAAMLAVVMTTAGLGGMILTRFAKGPTGPASTAWGGTPGGWSPPTPPAGGADAPPPSPPSPAPAASTAPREGGSSDAP